MDEMLLLDEGGYGGDYYEPYYNPVVYEEPAYIEPEPVFIPPPYIAPAPIEYVAPEPIYAEPEPLYELLPEPEYFGLPYVESEPIAYVEPASQSFPVGGPIIEEAFYVAPQEQALYLDQAPTEQVFEPIPIYQPAPVLVSEPEQFFELPFIPEPDAPFIPAPIPVSTDWAFCANENRRCGFSDTREVRYGKDSWDSRWTAPQIFTGGVDCSNEVFGDPWPGMFKECQARTVAAPEPVFEPVAIEPLSVGESMYTDDFGNTIESSIYTNGGGGDSFAVDYAEVYAPIDYVDYAPVDLVALEPPTFEPEPIFESFMPPFAPADLPFAPYEPIPLELPAFEPIPEFTMGFEEVPLAPVDLVPLESPEFFPSPEAPGLSTQNLFFDFLDYYVELGYDPSTAIALAEEDVASGSIVIPTEEQAPLPEPLSPILPFVPFTPEPFIPEQFFPLPFVPEEIPPPPPPAKLGPCDTPSGLPGVCAQGFYHPLNSPCDCVPFPLAPAPSPTQQPPTQTPTPAPKPPAVQAPKLPVLPQPCPTTHCKHPTTGQCIPTPQGYARHPQTQICTALTAQALPIPEPVTSALDDLKNLPWWVWAAGAGLLLLSQSGGDGERRTTITHRRA